MLMVPRLTRFGAEGKAHKVSMADYRRTTPEEQHPDALGAEYNAADILPQSLESTD